MTCPGTIVQFGIPRVAVGESATFGGNEASLRSPGVEVAVLGDERCEALMRRSMAARPEVWAEDIAE